MMNQRTVAMTSLVELVLWARPGCVINHLDVVAPVVCVVRKVFGFAGNQDN